MSKIMRVAGRAGTVLALAATVAGLSMGPANAASTWWEDGPLRHSLAQAKADIPGVKNKCVRGGGRADQWWVGDAGYTWYQANARCVQIRPF
ncbi:hypothetical protein [Amycolatopsis sp.]|uniref:hypothetical protein n=1 Tax=Amycolatopsis sp. TaxID=37632 RepID=UPI002D7FD79B|nr:hypothetical protein [Amycolatopsis sp.]HET6709685.1 hypothetical protein [Amycolatopsis sp.]